jgi:cytochrome c553
MMRASAVCAGLRALLPIGVLTLGAGTAAAAELLPPGEADYGYCTVCHGIEGRGNPAVGAPNLAVLEPWYVKRQLEAYRDGYRGIDPEDLIGVEMRPVAARLDDAAIEAVAEYVSTFDRAPTRPSVLGDADHGAALYETCAACHGEAGEGNEQLGGPPLAGQSDWYLVRQLGAYRLGWRGAHSDDQWGLQMKSMAANLAGEGDVLDVVAYISSLAERQQP